MKTPITKQIADRLEELAVQWKDHTSQAEALMMAAKEVMTFHEKDKEQMKDDWLNGVQNWDSETEFEDYYNKTYGGNK